MPILHGRGKNILHHPQQDHFLCCPAMKQQKKERLNEIQEKLRKIHTPITIRKTNIEQISSMYNNTKGSPRQVHSDFVTKQNNIGWRQFVRGRISKSILPLISAHLKSKNNQRITSTLWLIKVNNIILTTHTEAWKCYCNKKHEK